MLFGFSISTGKISRFFSLIPGLVLTSEKEGGDGRKSNGESIILLGELKSYGILHTVLRNRLSRQSGCFEAPYGGMRSFQFTQHKLNLASFNGTVMILTIVIKSGFGTRPVLKILQKRNISLHLLTQNSHRLF